MADNHFGDYIRQRRQDALLTRTELAKLANISVSLLEKIELGTRPTTLHTLHVLFDQLNVPPIYRKHILSQSLPDLFGITTSHAVPAPTADDLSDLHSLTHPASFYTLPAFTIIATNAAHRATFRGADPGTSFIEWMFLNPAARTVIIGWRQEAQRLLHSLRMLSPNPDTDERLAAVVHRCREAPEWDALWHAAPPHPTDTAGILIRKPDSYRTAEMRVRLYTPEYPARPWWLCRLIPSQRQGLQADIEGRGLSQRRVADPMATAAWGDVRGQW